ncbi:GrpB family protein [Streptomyces sp. NPDC059786]|uniref:GrpB family protein n=1 Tax=Streptomyces sp. NPDC059786 TaxID=3346946 RepID=UPI0036502A0E
MGEPVVETAEYDPRWPERAAAAIAESRDVLRETLTDITESRPTRNQRLLRDHLREHPRDAARYADLKRSPAAAGTVPAACTRAKTELVQELSDQARARLGLPSVPVREKTAHGPRP